MMVFVFEILEFFHRNQYYQQDQQIILRWKVYQLIINFLGG